ncbi:hypothetical protein ILYODFUR_021478 [Ilyodon furcidens]|uniref:Uncharacterized protein n=1 Tax=Ilyodon furcidens TaxID=33524 RepID=A0ABV0T0D1_9TELE
MIPKVDRCRQSLMSMNSCIKRCIIVERWQIWLSWRMEEVGGSVLFRDLTDLLAHDDAGLISRLDFPGQLFYQINGRRWCQFQFSLRYNLFNRRFSEGAD